MAILDALHYIDADLLGWWLCERQVKEGGLNGRPEKLPDVNRKKFNNFLIKNLKVCYSWWVLSSLTIIERIDWIDKEKVKPFILASQVFFIIITFL